MTTTFLVVLFALLNAIDIFVTMYAIKVGLHEKNPIIHLVMKHLGMLGVLGTKFIIVLGIIIFIDSFSEESLVLLNIIYSLILLNNLLKLYIGVIPNDSND